MLELFDVVNLPPDAFELEAERLGQRLNLARGDRQKLNGLLGQIRVHGIAFEANKIRRTVTGSAPRSSAWYPDARMASWIYYEPRFTFARAIYVDRMQGWGTSNQWREDASHRISPKLAFTTSTNAQAGLKAFVLNEPWIVLKAAGMRQQLNYTGVENPLNVQQLNGPNNLGDEALVLYNALHELGCDDEDFLLYVASIYNSTLAEEYLSQGGDNTMRIPVDPTVLDMEVVVKLIHDARYSRNLVATNAKLEEIGFINESESLVPLDILKELGLTRSGGSGGRFAQTPTWASNEVAIENITSKIETLKSDIDAAVMLLFESLPV